MEQLRQELLDAVQSGTSMGITGASIGQIIKVAEVNADGKPIAWEATDLQNEADAIDSLTELGFVNPIADENNTIYTDDNNTIYSL